MSESIWIIEDDEVFGATLQRSLSRRDHQVEWFALLPTDAQLQEVKTVDKLILDLKLGQDTSLHFIPRMREAHPECAILVLTGFASINTAVQAVKMGAVNYLAKPASVSEILAAFCGEAVSESSPIEPMSVERLEWEHIQRVLEQTEGNISEAARLLKMHRRTLQRKLQKKPKSQ